VLEGIGLIDKQSKNHVVWRGTPIDPATGVPAAPSSDAAAEAAATVEEAELEAAVAALAADAASLDTLAARLGGALASLAAAPACRARLYVTTDEVAALPLAAGGDTGFAVTAPQGTALVVPDPSTPDAGAPALPSAGPRYRAQLSCAADAADGIEVWLVAGPVGGGPPPPSAPAAPPPPPLSPHCALVAASAGASVPPSPGGGDAARAWLAAEAGAPSAMAVADLFGDGVDV
jgi:hypothetical protein